MRKNIILELCIALLLLLVPSHIFLRLSFYPLLGQFLPGIVAFLLLYIPLFFLRKTRTPLTFLDQSPKEFLSSFRLFIFVSIIVLPVFGILAHVWVTIIYRANFELSPFSYKMWELVLFQLLVIALPEEFFFRGYMQSRLNRLFPAKPWKIFGVYLGKSWLLTAFIFAFAHSAITFQWWHFSIFFPALLFGYLRERTGSITASVFFHAACNVFMAWFISNYLFPILKTSF